ncbi:MULTISPECIES: penicillin-binding protein 2 [Prochlorococcus]|uniref:Cell division protein FtsI (Peptidoglycan synthetase) n=1 Tax=Prochlorococcus marinus str. MIT 9116 TaxID=167544 RepID=A0A0A1ZNX8_PROMR|nr:penicillin-binding protein 2 [Prochlorococcus marinus]KGF89390.1 Cell division protein FtsI (Peptidoglycan synthetase) [Prochlorococcus marinus str. MIT 9107]KGF91120.1 Cell division protein FtsI (Peptidoglycan synthetase) [Prochlorococcus marinus str. MIT 9116]KGF94439.1 Cell division protein FtsI (Peptidoglycan synthetase) [Prochlorococcus marinus str. MIT 9123]
MIKSNSNKDRILLKRQPLVLLIFSSVSFLLILLRLIFLQLLNYESFKKMSDENRIRLIASQPIRGRIIDKNGYILADSRVRYSLIIKPQSVNESNWEKHKLIISDLLNIDSNLVQKKYLDGLKNQQFSVTIIDDLNVDQLIKFKENEDNLFSFQIATKLIRNYPYKSVAAHVIGYTQPITDSEYKFLFKKGYKLNDLIGRTGIEYAYEDFIRGEWGGEMIEVNSLGKFQKSLGIKPPKQGNHIELTIDMNLQLVAEEVLKDKKAGAIIVMDPRDGAIRAMASKPTFDLNFFSKDFKPEKEYNKLFNSSEKPLFNRALNAYDPGSVWKIVTALAGLESGKFPSDTLLDTKPCITYGGQCFREHNDLGFGVIGYEDALRVSSNTFFYQVGYGVGVDQIHEVSKKLGFNSLSGIEISEQENIGLVANSEWAKKGRGWGEPGRTPWVPEDIASMSIGQFVVQVTPIQIARAYAAIANGGYLVTPHLAKKDGEYLTEKRRIKIDIDKGNIQLIKSGLRKVVESGTGVSINYGVSNLPPVSGKTGTAEDGEGGSDHAWFVCYTPSEKSELVIVAFAQNTPGGGSVHALPMAREILKVWNEMK